ncbi:MAG: AraC family transcriptional regulator [Pseudomonadales bacterium]|nr:AraC family transcriptional regulator [Pseudomonadales bacterium]NRA14857.1 AraC family transcriptional regulator [Oceanospirillaceae bacterium]
MDKFTRILNNFSIATQVIFNGSFCGSKTLGSNLAGGCGHLHFLRSGKLTVLSDRGHKLVFEQPTVIMLPYSTEHKIVSTESENVDVVCATIQFSPLQQRQLLANLPKLICLDITTGELHQTVHWLFKEADGQQLGQQSIVNKLCEIFMIQMLRQLSAQGIVLQGMLAGLSHPALAKTIVMLQEAPEQDWNLASMASSAAMSRSKFAGLFRDTVGQTANEFLTDLRVALAQELLQQNQPVSLVANRVGYEHGSALARVFRKKTGLSPKQWLEKLHK